MDRRKSLKKIALATGSLVTLPSWAEAWNTESLNFVTSSFTDQEQQLLSSVTDTLIPEGDSVGALTVKVDQFLLKLFEDCYQSEVQNNIKTELQGMERRAQIEHGKPFSSCDQSQRLIILEMYANSEDEEQLKTFNLIKSETIRGFRSSRIVMTEYLDYQVIPGHFHGCVEINS